MKRFFSSVFIRSDFQELHVQVEALREENAALKRRLDAIERKLQ